MRIEQLTKKQKDIRPNMDYLIDFNGTKQYFSKSAILELQTKLNKLFICDVSESLKYKPKQTFDEFITGIYKNRGISLINNYTKEVVGLDALIEKWKATNA